MPDQSSGVSPTPPVPEFGRDKPRLGAGEEAQEPKPFSLPPEPGKKGAEAAPTGLPSPMDAARERAQSAPLPPEQLSDKIQKLQNNLDEVQTKLQNPNVTNKFTNDHFTALNRVLDKMNPDYEAIAKNSNGQFIPPEKKKGQNVLEYVSNWIDGSQQTLTQALNYLSKEQSPNPAAYLQLQYGVQRATQRGELFASIVGASVSGIKTILSTQLG